MLRRNISIQSSVRLSFNGAVTSLGNSNSPLICSVPLHTKTKKTMSKYNRWSDRAVLLWYLLGKNIRFNRLFRKQEFWQGCCIYFFAASKRCQSQHHKLKGNYPCCRYFDRLINRVWLVIEPVEMTGERFKILKFMMLCLSP